MPREPYDTNEKNISEYMNMLEKNYLKANGIRKSYRLSTLEVPVLNGVDLSVAKGEWVALLGASGSGKTTLLNILGLLEKPDDGTVEIGGEMIFDFGRTRKARFLRNRIGFIFQAFHLLPELSVFENIKLPGMLSSCFGKQLDERVRDLAEKAGLSHRINHRPNELSGGEQQRVAIIRSMVNSPELILADEPTGNLDSATGREILEIFQDLRRSEELRTIIMVTHNRDVASIADRIVTLKDGCIEN